EEKLLFAAHMERDVQKTQSRRFNGWVKNTQGEEAISQANDDVLITKTGWTSAEWIAHGEERGLSPKQCSSALEVMYHLGPLLAAELGVMKDLMAQKCVPLEDAHRRSRKMCLAYKQDDSAA